MKILVTGGNSMVASHIKALKKDCEVNYISSTRFNLTQYVNARLAVDIYKPDIVIHTAGKVGSMIDNMNNKYDYMVDNLLINTNIIQACLHTQVPKLIAISSTCAYPDVLGDGMYPMGEECIHLGCPTETSIGYAYSKRMMQLQIDLCNEQYGTKYNYIIPSNIYSEFDKHSGERMHFLTRLLYRIYEAEKNKATEIVMDGSGEVYRQYLYGGDLAQAIKDHIVHGTNESYNIAGENLKLSELADLTLEALGLYESKRVIFANKIPVGQVRKDVSNLKFYKINPDFKFSDFKTQIRKVYGALKNKWQLN